MNEQDPGRLSPYAMTRRDHIKAAEDSLAQAERAAREYDFNRIAAYSALSAAHSALAQAKR